MNPHYDFVCIYNQPEWHFLNQVANFHRFRWYATLENKHSRKRFQSACYRQIGSKSTNHSQLVWPSDLLCVMLAGCDWWISIRSDDNIYDLTEIAERFHGCFVFQSRVSTKTVLIALLIKILGPNNQPCTDEPTLVLHFLLSCCGTTVGVAELRTFAGARKKSRKSKISWICGQVCKSVNVTK